MQDSPEEDYPPSGRKRTGGEVSLSCVDVVVGGVLRRPPKT